MSTTTSSWSFFFPFLVTKMKSNSLASHARRASKSLLALSCICPDRNQSFGYFPVCKAGTLLFFSTFECFPGSQDRFLLILIVSTLSYQDGIFLFPLTSAGLGSGTSSSSSGSSSTMTGCSSPDTNVDKMKKTNMIAAYQLHF